MSDYTGILTNAYICLVICVVTRKRRYIQHGTHRVYSNTSVRAIFTVSLFDNVLSPNLTFLWLHHVMIIFSGVMDQHSRFGMHVNRELIEKFPHNNSVK